MARGSLLYCFSFFQLETGCKLGVRLLGKQKKQFLGLLAQVGGQNRQKLQVFLSALRFLRKEIRNFLIHSRELQTGKENANSQAGKSLCNEL